ncbi:MAG: AAA family ATPase [Chitinophagaceae bacterium]|nr:AAA family ATPase [Chitinophagaceae bacterium]
MNEIKYILVNVSWNSNDWKGVSGDKSGHKWVSKGNTPHESWNFDFGNSRNTPELIRGYCQFTKPPKVTGNNNLIIFYSKNQIVGFYGNAEVLPIAVNINKQESYNLVGVRPLCVLLNNKITDALEKGYLEDKQRVGQIGFSYLEKEITIKKIIHEAIKLNPDQREQLNVLLGWLQIEKYEDPFFTICKKQIPEDLKFYLDYLRQLTRSLDLIEDDVRLVFSCKQNKLSFIVGQRYCVNMRNDNGKTEFAFITQTETDLKHSEFDGKAKAYYNLTDKSQHLNEQIANVMAAIKVELGRTKISGISNSDNKFFRNSIFSKSTSTENHHYMNESSSLNTILFGPPGTGKTYHTITESVKIVDNEYFKQHVANRNKLQDRFNELLIKDWNEPKGQISFCTFHQSFSYEDFVEGIKPIAPKEGDTYLKYKVEWGIFKNICRLADADNNAQKLAKENLVSLTQDEFDKAVFYKISLGDSTKDEDKEIYDYCVSNNVISIGFGESTNFTGKDETQVNDIVTKEKLDTYTAQAINYFKNYLKVGNYVVVSYGNSYIRALGKVTGDYEYKPDAEIRYKHFRKVDWIFKNVEIPVAEFYQKNLSQQTIYKLKSEYIIPEFFVRRSKLVDNKIQQKNFVLIIDEINRGNVSSIFGELITLVEPSKRSGKNQLEALEVVLPYSKERFTVPSNVYIIGTMNTADRSIESLDTALRRRFSFKEMTSLPGLIATDGKSKATKGVVDGIDIVQMLQKMNERIEKLIDKDHKIGHSYFLDIVNVKDLELAFKDKVIPLLEEYFFGDFGKIGLVLGNSFVKKEDAVDFDFADFADYDAQTEQDLKLRSVYKIRPVSDWDYKRIYEPKPKP